MSCKDKIVIGVGGNIGTGKTTVSKIFQKFGADYVSADEIGWQVLTNIREELETRFGTAIMNGSKIDRTKLRKIVFSNNKNLRFLNRLSHPVLIKRVLKRLQMSRTGIIVLDAALLFDWPEVYQKIDYPILVTADNRLKEKRALAKGIDKKTFQQILKKQKKDAQMSQHARFIIKNNGSLKALTRQCWNIYKEIRDDC